MPRRSLTRQEVASECDLNRSAWVVVDAYDTPYTIGVLVRVDGPAVTVTLTHHGAPDPMVRVLDASSVVGDRESPVRVSDLVDREVHAMMVQVAGCTRPT